MRPSHIRVFIFVLVVLGFVGWAIPTGANLIIEYNWWKELGQIPTWLGMLWYSTAPAALGTLVAFIALYVAHARGLHFAGVRPRDVRLYSRLIPLGLALVALLFASASIDYWTVMRFFGSRGLPVPPDAWKDPVFSHALTFYLFDLPFYSDLLGFVFVLAILSAVVFWATARGWQLLEHFRFSRLRGGAGRTLLILAAPAAAGRHTCWFRPRNRSDFIARFCHLGLSRELRTPVCVSRLHDRRRLCRSEDYASSALAADHRRRWRRCRWFGRRDSRRRSSSS